VKVKVKNEKQGQQMITFISSRKELHVLADSLNITDVICIISTIISAPCLLARWIMLIPYLFNYYIKQNQNTSEKIIVNAKLQFQLFFII
jgi:hypothetical protein